jgi:hypothetical protein
MAQHTLDVVPEEVGQSASLLQSRTPEFALAQII